MYYLKIHREIQSFHLHHEYAGCAGNNDANFKMTYEFKYRVYAEALYDALQDNAFYMTMEESVDSGSSKEAMIKYIDYSIKEGEQYGKIVIPESHEFGVSVWAKPINEKLEKEKNKQKKIFISDHMGQGSLETYDSIVKFMWEKAIPLIDENSWYLSIIGILPEFQGRGLGAGLVVNILEKTDRLRIPTYVETFTSKNITFYNRLGYKTVEDFHEPTTDAKYWLMIRDLINP